MPTLSLLYNREYAVNDDIHVVIPTVGQILEDEDSYYGMITTFTAMPIDFMVQLDELGIDFTEISDYDLFLILFNGLKGQKTNLLFKDLDIDKFQLTQNQQTGDLFLINAEDHIMIDRRVYGQISAVFRKVHHIERNRRKPANDDAKKYMLQRAKEKQRRNKNRKVESQLESLIVAMVNAPEFKYDYDGAKNLSIFQFNESVRQIIKRVDYNNRMFGVYSGTINAKEMSQDDLTWLTHK
ncbi:MAG: hypothetical protein MJZ03_00155 [archaeon]|nr:hypothetical protein [archaeon]